jgi:autotransporter-associated beta strand protein
MRICRSHVRALVCSFAAVATFATPAAGQSTYTWNTTTGSAWLTSADWSGTPANFPGVTANGTGNNAGDTAAFGAMLPSALAVGIDMSNSNGNAKQLLQLGAITFSNSSNDLVIGNSSVQKNGTLQLNGATVTIGGVPTANVVLDLTSAQTLTIQNTANGGTQTMGVALGATTSIVNVASGGAVAIPSVVSETTGGAKGMTLSGAGTLKLSAANAYTGGTTVSGGTLSALNTSGSATGTGAVTVSAGGRLAGTGAVVPNTGSQATNTVTVAGTVQPGTDSATGYLTLGSATALTTTSVNGTFAWSFSNSGSGSTSPPVAGASDTNNSANQSRLVVNGDLTLAPTTFNVIGLTGLSFDNTKYYSWRIATAAGTVIVGAQPTFNVTGLNTGGGTFTLSGGVGTGYLNFAPIPEPATILLMCGGAAGAVHGARRWRNRGSGRCRTLACRKGTIA